MSILSHQLKFASIRNCAATRLLFFRLWRLIYVRSNKRIRKNIWWIFLVMLRELYCVCYNDMWFLKTFQVSLCVGTEKRHVLDCIVTTNVVSFKELSTMRRWIIDVWITRVLYMFDCNFLTTSRLKKTQLC